MCDAQRPAAVLLITAQPPTLTLSPIMTTTSPARALTQVEAATMRQEVNAAAVRLAMQAANSHWQEHQAFLARAERQDRRATMAAA